MLYIIIILFKAQIACLKALNKLWHYYQDLTKLILKIYKIAFIIFKG